MVYAVGPAEPGNHASIGLGGIEIPNQLRHAFIHAGASIGLGGIEIRPRLHCHGYAHRLQSDWEELKFGEYYERIMEFTWLQSDWEELKSKSRGKPASNVRCFNRTGRN